MNPQGIQIMKLSALFKRTVEYIQRKLPIENWKLNNKEPNENLRAEKHSIDKKTSMGGFNDTIEKTKERMIWKISRMKQLHTTAFSSPCTLHTMQSTKNIRDTEDRKTNVICKCSTR